MPTGHKEDPLVLSDDDDDGDDHEHEEAQQVSTTQNELVGPSTIQLKVEDDEEEQQDSIPDSLLPPSPSTIHSPESSQFQALSTPNTILQEISHSQPVEFTEPLVQSPSTPLPNTFLQESPHSQPEEFCEPPINSQSTFSPALLMPTEASVLELNSPVSPLLQTNTPQTPQDSKHKRKKRKENPADEKAKKKRTKSPDFKHHIPEMLESLNEVSQLLVDLSDEIAYKAIKKILFVTSILMKCDNNASMEAPMENESALMLPTVEAATPSTSLNISASQIFPIPSPADIEMPSVHVPPPFISPVNSLPNLPPAFAYMEQEQPSFSFDSLSAILADSSVTCSMCYGEFKKENYSLHVTQCFAGYCMKHNLKCLCSNVQKEAPKPEELHKETTPRPSRAKKGGKTPTQREKEKMVAELTSKGFSGYTTSLARALLRKEYQKNIGTEFVYTSD